MITIKNKPEIELMKAGGRILHQAFEKITPLIKPGVKTIEINDVIEKFIVDNGGSAGFKTVTGYNFASCISINDQVVHTQPSDRTIQKGDIVTVDAGVLYQELHTDKSITFYPDGTDDHLRKFLLTGQQTLKKAIKKAIPGNYIYDISKTIEDNITGAGYFIIKELTGHGVGRSLHEEPMIPGYPDRQRLKTYRLVPGMTLAIEIIYSQGTNHIKPEAGDKWSLNTIDGSISACFEDTILVTKNNPLILT